ncbi:flotillin family protein [Calidithermus chliarophilus]|uniref:flotillin family protein n=1 Tax=Calidithermus chliarophilus TaxID=52023 RepID=UPI0004243DD4|nr:SPFH domain-containing protein [Calidithermus chliarophilus]
MVVAFVVVSIALIGLSLFGPSYVPNWSALNSAVSGVLGLVVLLVGLLAWMIQRFYIKPSANLAYVMTGFGGRRVMIDRGGFFFPIIQRYVPVSLETMKLEVERKGPDALITKDNLRLDVKAEFYIKVLPNETDVLNASRSLGEKSVTPQAVSELVFEKLVSALRSVAATQDLVEIHAQRDVFATSVQQLVRSDLEQNGLTLESVTISRLDQTSQDLLSDSNIFDAQGKRKITEITQAALVERNRLEQEARRAITLKNVETQQEILGLERTQAQAEAAQQAEIAKVTAEKKREADIYRIEQERLTREAEIVQEQSVKTAAIERDKLLLLKEQERQTTDVEREKAVALAEREREIAVTEAERRRAEAEKAALEAQAEREKANQSVITVQQLAEAEREAQTRLITAKQAIEQDRIRKQTEAEVAAFAEVRKAEAAKTAAQLEAEAAITRARAEAEAQELIAKGQTAGKMVDVDVERERVSVEQARVNVERQALENKQTYSQAALEFELQKLKVEALRDVQAELARSIGQFMSKGNMNIYGDPATLAKMTEQYTKGLGVGNFLDGISTGSNGQSTELIQQILELVQGLANKSGLSTDKNPPSNN